MPAFDNDLLCADLPPDIGNVHAEQTSSAPQVTEAGIDMPQTIAEIEKEMILQALNLGNGVKAKAASLLGINRTTLVEKIKRLNVEI